jgi:hypothetical protein
LITYEHTKLKRDCGLKKKYQDPEPVKRLQELTVTTTLTEYVAVILLKKKRPRKYVQRQRTKVNPPKVIGLD